MDEKLDNIPKEEPIIGEPAVAEENVCHVSRPAWQVWLARICLVLFLALVAMYYINMMRGV